MIKKRYCSYAVKKKPQSKEPIAFEWGEEFHDLKQAWKKARGGKKQTLWFHAFDLHCERRCKGTYGKALTKCEIECEQELDEFLEG